MMNISQVDNSTALETNGCVSASSGILMKYKKIVFQSLESDFIEMKMCILRMRY